MIKAFSTLFKMVDWSKWVPIIVSVLTLISTICLNIYNRYSIRKENKEMYDLNIEKDKMEKRLKSYEEALSLLEVPFVSTKDMVNYNKHTEAYEKLANSINNVMAKGLLLLDDKEEKELQNKLKKAHSISQKAAYVRNIAANKRRELLKEEKKVMKR